MDAYDRATATSARQGIPEDLEHDPTFSRQRQLAAWLLGTAINALRGGRLVWDDPPDKRKIADEIQEIALRNGIVAFYEWHHAPMCPANNWSKAMLPRGPCTCGAARKKIR